MRPRQRLRADRYVEGLHEHRVEPRERGERREESALRRSGRTVPDQVFEHFAPFDLTTIDAAIEELTQAEVLVIATPRYNYGMPAALKA